MAKFIELMRFLLDEARHMMSRWIIVYKKLLDNKSSVYFILFYNVSFIVIVLVYLFLKYKF